MEVNFSPSLNITVTFSNPSGGGGSFSCSELLGCTIFTEVQSQATEALSTANSAATLAGTANTNATNALSAASTATTTANNAQSTATTANNTANSANTTANNVQTALNNLTTTTIAEGSNLFFTVARVLATALTGVVFTDATSISATDTVLQAFGKLQAQINNILALFEKGYKPLAISTAVQSHTGNTSLSPLYSMPYSVGDIIANDLIKFKAAVSKIGANGNHTIGIYWNSTNNISTAILLGSTVTTLGNPYLPFERTFAIRSLTSLVAYSTTTPTANDSTAAANSAVSIINTVNFGVSGFLIFGVTLGSASDTETLQRLEITRTRI